MSESDKIKLSEIRSDFDGKKEILDNIRRSL